MKLNPKIEKIIKEESMKLLEKCKVNWDIPHTLDTVKWMKKLIKNEGGNEKILITTMYLHDTGYPYLKNYNFSELIKSKENHATIAAENAKYILNKLNFTKKEIACIAHLIKYHDKHKNIKTKDRQLVMEADALAKIDWYIVKPNLDKANTQKYFDYYKKECLPHFKTQTGKKLIKTILSRAENYLANWK
ncbi:MAG: HD domain-containing protein [Patescibacteria group bacterium]|nr:HD domain-containing protein [Patescibacteria group bacterium]MDD4610401.1 HD domain-containing protein [Patescibacteria group bacterium]